MLIASWLFSPSYERKIWGMSSSVSLIWLLSVSSDGALVCPGVCLGVWNIWKNLGAFYFEDFFFRFWIWERSSWIWDLGVFLSSKETWFYWMNKLFLIGFISNDVTSAICKGWSYMSLKFLLFASIYWGWGISRALGCKNTGVVDLSIFLDLLELLLELTLLPLL